MAEADEWDTACAVALVDATMALMAAAHSTTNVFMGQNPSTGGCGGIVYTTAMQTARPFHNYVALKDESCQFLGRSILGSTVAVRYSKSS